MCTEQSKDERIRELEDELKEYKEELKNYRDAWLESEKRHKISGKIIEELNGKNARMCLELKALKEKLSIEPFNSTIVDKEKHKEKT